MCSAPSLLTSAGGRAQLSAAMGSRAPWSPPAIISTNPETLPAELSSVPCIWSSSCPPCHCRRLFLVHRSHSMVGSRKHPCCHHTGSGHCCLPLQSWPLSAPACVYTPYVHSLKIACYPGALSSLWAVMAALVLLCWHWWWVYLSVCFPKMAPPRSCTREKESREHIQHLLSASSPSVSYPC